MKPGTRAQQKEMKNEIRDFVALMTVLAAGTVLTLLVAGAYQNWAHMLGGMTQSQILGGPQHYPGMAARLMAPVFGS